MKIAIHRPGAFNTGCTHPRVRHRHGTSGCYWEDACRCDDCRKAVFRANKRRSLYPNPKVPAVLAAARINELRANGWTVAAIARETGLSPTWLPRLGTEARHVYTSTVMKLNQLPTCPPAPQIVRRLRALAAIGWTYERMAELVGTTKYSIRDWARGLKQPSAKHVETILTKWDAASVQAFDDPSARRAKASAQRQNWAPPAAWDDIDDPNETPKGVRTSHEKHAVRYETDVVWRLKLGETIETIAKDLGIQPASLERRIARARSTESRAA